MKKTTLYFLVLINSGLMAQIGGTKAFRFLETQVPARSAALGGATSAIWDDDINLSFSNPALLHPGCSKRLAFNYVNYVSDLNYGNFAYAQKIKKYGTFGVGLQYYSYGKFDGRDEYDEKTGTFKAADYSLNLSFAKTLNQDSTLSLGVAIKTLYSHYDIYTAFGNAVDVGLTYHDKKQLTISLVARNYGRQWKPFFENSPKEPLPFDMVLGISKKIPKAPFRVILEYDQLLKWDLTYVNPQDADSEIDPFTNKPIVKTARQKRNEKINKGMDKFGRHLTVGAEILITKNFNVRVAYNYRNGKEMGLPDKKVANGLSVGVGIKIYKFHFNYAYSKYAYTGNANTIGVTTNLNYFTKK